MINIILKRNFDGAITQLHFSAPDAGIHYQASQGAAPGTADRLR